MRVLMAAAVAAGVMMIHPVTPERIGPVTNEADAVTACKVYAEPTRSECIAAAHNTDWN